MMFDSLLSKFSEEQREKIQKIATRFNMKPSELIKRALEKPVKNTKEIDLEIEKLSKELSELTSIHAPLSSKVASLTFKYHELYQVCGSHSIAIMGLEAENQTLSNSLHVKYDNTLRKKEEELFDKYHKQS
jgi:NADH dehydrogenase/NADH:ubiquinone oxidoreductase subunit G